MCALKRYKKKMVNWILTKPIEWCTTVCWTFTAVDYNFLSKKTISSLKQLLLQKYSSYQTIKYPLINIIITFFFFCFTFSLHLEIVKPIIQTSRAHKTWKFDRSSEAFRRESTETAHGALAASSFAPFSGWRFSACALVYHTSLISRPISSLVKELRDDLRDPPQWICQNVTKYI